jgi:hypothetical protein
MSIGADVIGQMPVSAQAQASPTGKPPKKRITTAKADAVERPEAR